MVLLDGYSLSAKQLFKLCFGDDKVGVSDLTIEKVEKSFNFLSAVNSRYNIYGINTGLGPMAQYSIEEQQLLDLQYNLIRSHHTGFPHYLGPAECKAVFLARLNSLVRGHSAVSKELIFHMVSMFNSGIVPCIPLHGGVGASGDLVQLAHLAAVVIGEGICYFNGNIIQAEEAYKLCGLTAKKLVLREGLAMMNGTSAMTGLAAINLEFAFTALGWNLAFSVMINELMEAFNDHYSVELNAVKKHQGQMIIAAAARKILEDSPLVRSRNNFWEKDQSDEFFREKVQEYYSLRCIPQILGPIYDTLLNGNRIIEDELNSSNDNPITDIESSNIYHGGNFHGDYISLEMDKLKLVMTRATMLSERQLNYLLNNRLNQKLPSFINLSVLGLNFGLQGMQFTATSTTAENQTLSASSYVHSISCNNDNQDIVSMGFNAATIAARVIDNTFEVLAIEAIAVIQAVDALDLQGKLSSYSNNVYKELRNLFPVIGSDRITSQEMEAIKDYLKNTRQEILN
ncbi:MAG: aromatic amino acid lyase [Bacteroidetes bacterium]|nr:aromatic amino acid lyase [Bacteroidota bacterium]